MTSGAVRLRKLFSRPGIIKLAGAHNALSAKLVQAAGFDGVWSSGFEISTSYAVPDASLLTMSEFLDAARRMVDATAIPVVADCDTGFGNVHNVIRTVREFEAAGVAAVCIEDKTFPKLNSLVPGCHDLVSIKEFTGRIRAAKNTQRDSDFMVIARVEALVAGCNLEEALARACSYAEAGADAVLIHSQAPTPDPVVAFIRAWDFQVPLVVVPTTYYTITAGELEALGAKMVIYANHGIRAAITAVQEILTEILRSGSTASVESRIAPMKLVFELQGMPKLLQDEATYLLPEASKTPTEATSTAQSVGA